MRWNAELSCDRSARLMSSFGVGVGRESAGPGDVTVAGRVVSIAPLAENPLCSVMRFAEGEIITGDVLLASGEAFFGHGKLVHESEAKVALFGAEIHGQKAAGKMLSGFPTDLMAE